MMSYALIGQVGIGSVVARLVGKDIPFAYLALGGGKARVFVADAHRRTLENIIDVTMVQMLMRGEAFTREEV